MQLKAAFIARLGHQVAFICRIISWPSQRLSPRFEHLMARYLLANIKMEVLSYAQAWDLEMEVEHPKPISVSWKFVVLALIIVHSGFAIANQAFGIYIDCDICDLVLGNWHSKAFNDATLFALPYFSASLNLITILLIFKTRKIEVNMMEIVRGKTGNHYCDGVGLRCTGLRGVTLNMTRQLPAKLRKWTWIYKWLLIMMPPVLSLLVAIMTEYYLLIGYPLTWYSILISIPYDALYFGTAYVGFGLCIAQSALIHLVTLAYDHRFRMLGLRLAKYRVTRLTPSMSLWRSVVCGVISFHQFTRGSMSLVILVTLVGFGSTIIHLSVTLMLGHIDLVSQICEMAGLVAALASVGFCFHASQTVMNQANNLRSAIYCFGFRESKMPKLKYMKHVIKYLSLVESLGSNRFGFWAGNMGRLSRANQAMVSDGLGLPR